MKKPAVLILAKPIFFIVCQLQKENEESKKTPNKKAILTVKCARPLGATQNGQNSTTTSYNLR
jgi:hypothetical protein